MTAPAIRPPFEPFDGPELLSEAQRTYLEGYVRSAYDRLGLRDWQVRVSRRTHEKSSIAATWREDNGDVAVVAFSKRFLDDPADDQRWTVAHEVLHLHLARMTTYVVDMVRHELGNTAERLFLDAFDTHEELAVDRMARFVAELLPMPEVPDA